MTSGGTAAGLAQARGPLQFFRERLWTAWFALPVVLCVAVYWDALHTWFLTDDYAWLGLPLQLHSWKDLGAILFAPKAQGTVRVLSERLFFLAFSSSFGMDAAPFKLCVWLTHFANLVLLGAITLRLSGSRVAAIAAPVIWTVNAALLVPLAWISAYNQVLWVSCLLSSFYLLLKYLDTGQRKYLVAQWAVYLAGFGVLELNVMYPAIALLYVLLCARERWRVTLPLFVPSVLFTVVHLVLVPKAPDPLYRVYVDLDLFETLARFFAWGFGPSRLGFLVDERWRGAGYAITAAIGVALIIYVGVRARRREWVPLFLLAWFLLTVAPVLPLKLHRLDYYLYAPTTGFAMLAACAFAAAWRKHILLVLCGIVLFGAYAAGMIAQVRPDLAWRRHNSHRLRALLDGVEEARRRRPATVLLLRGVDRHLFAAGFNDQPFRLLGFHRAYLAPGEEKAVQKGGPELRGLDNYRISQPDALRVLESGDAIVLAITDSGLRDMTKTYTVMARAGLQASEQRRIELGLPGAAHNLGPTWYPAESGFRWMPESATVRIAAPVKSGEVLHIDGYAPAVAIERGPVTLRVSAEGINLGTLRLTTPDTPISLDLPLPDRLVGRGTMSIDLSVDRTFVLPQDGRKLGLIFNRLELRE
jgi:hypothetical protein